MTRKQREVLEGIKQFIEREGYSPSFQEIMELAGMSSKSQVFRVINSLEEQGYIRRLPNRVRTLEIVENPTLPKTVREFSVRELAAEAALRGFALGKVVEEWHHGQGEAPYKIRKFKIWTEESNG